MISSLSGSLQTVDLRFLPAHPWRFVHHCQPKPEQQQKISLFHLGVIWQLDQRCHFQLH